MKPMLPIGALALFAGLLTASAAEPTTAPAAEAASQPHDLHAMTPQAFADYAPASQRIPEGQVNVPLLEAAIFHESNRARVKEGVPAAVWSRKLNRIARLHSQEMAKLQFFAHESPVPENRTLVQRLAQVGLTNVTAAENIAVRPTMEMGSGTYQIIPQNGQTIRKDAATGQILQQQTYRGFAEEVVKQWLNSPGHRKNLLDKNQKFMGIGVGPGQYKNQDAAYVTQNFAGDIGKDDAKTELPPPRP